MRQLLTALAMTSGCVLAAGCTHSVGGEASKASPTTSTTWAAPLTEKDLPGLMLSTGETNAALGTSGMALIPHGGVGNQMPDTSSGTPDKDCVVLSNNAEATVYAGSGYVATYGQVLRDDPDIEKAKYDFTQAVVSFPSASDARTFFTASAQRWPACSNQTFQHGTASWTAGPVSNNNGTLSATVTQEGQNGWACQRALTVANNIVIDIDLCSYNPGNSAVSIAHQIADKVAKQ